MSERLRAAGVHLLTATGAAFALLALIAAKRGDWQLMFIWLGVALIVDTVDGPLARRVGVVKVLPRFKASRSDRRFPHLCGGSRLRAQPVRSVIGSLPLACRHRRHPVELVPSGRPGEQNQGRLFSRLPHHLERRLPLSLRPRPPPFVSLFIVAFFVALTFVPILAVHPFRVAEWRSFTWLVTVLWAVGAIGAVANPFPSPLWVKVLLVATASCLTGVGALHMLREGKVR
jgi:phosphatidylcholine synthase